jgi:hypothetical protein
MTEIQSPIFKSINWIPPFGNLFINTQKFYAKPFVIRPNNLTFGVGELSIFKW